MTRVLVVDDDAQLLRALRITLAARGYDVLTAADGLDIPTSAVFGKQGRDRFDLYIGNGAYSVLGPSNNTPSIMRLHLGVPGAPDHP